MVECNRKILEDQNVISLNTNTQMKVSGQPRSASLVLCWNCIHEAEVLPHDPEFLNTGNILVSNQVKPHEALEFDPDTNESVWRRSRSTRQRHQYDDGQQNVHDKC